ncbi:hypothetical protein BDY21DRAFT_350588 [Lineolata rhizophorae]|uniref:Uncharacterized protein n=1 Tax=Lineolata rhizophorae TaxID=578093 RepID=A0A6A6NV55_9PEZI|nr:hypothetical protein BDY21DRAFT_350588 [Lineolata rhizophorae]
MLEEQVDGSSSSISRELRPSASFSHLLAIALAYSAFRRDLASVEEIFYLEIPADQDILRLRGVRGPASLPRPREDSRGLTGL